MSVSDPRKSHFRVQTDPDTKHIEDTISFNVKVMLAFNGMNQTDLANALGMKRSTISVKLNGRIGWSAADLVKTANVLHTSPQALLDDTLMEQSRKVHGGETETAPGDPGADGAPAAGLEPATVRLTVGCSAN